MNSSKRRRSTKAAAGAVLLAVMLTTAACSSGSNDPIANKNSNEEQNFVNDIPQTDNIPGQSGISDSGVAAPDKNEENNSTNVGGEDPEAAVLEGEGIFVGAIDSNSIEISTDDGPEVFRLTSEFAYIVNDVPADAKVNYKYKVKIIDNETKQNWLTKFELTD